MGLDSVYARAYPGLLFRRPIEVIGGAWPYCFELLNGPSGMSIGSTLPANWLTAGYQAYGVLTWPNPVAGSHRVAVRVTDQLGVQVTRQWTLTVTTTGFLFVDGATGNDSNTGTIGSPLRSWSGVYGTDKADPRNDGAQVIWRQGRYRTDLAPVENAIRIAMPSHKAHAHLAYPGERVTFDTRIAHLSFYPSSSDVAFVGIRFEGFSSASTWKTLVFDAAQRTTVFECEFGTQLDPGLAGMNPAHLFFSNGGTDRFVTVSRSRFEDVDDLLGAELYGIDDVLFDGNVVQTLRGSGARFVYAKATTNRLVVRGTRGHVAIEGPLLMVDTYSVQTGIEASWNSWRTQPGKVLVHLGNEVNALGSVVLYRNTFALGHLLHRNATAGMVTSTRNVVQHDGQFPLGIESLSFSASFTTLDDLRATTGLVDQTNALSGNFRTQYLGTRGAEVR